MNEFYYDVQYILYENGNMKDTGAMLIRSSTELNIDQIKRHIKGQLGQPQAVLTLSRNRPIDKETFVMMGGSDKAPWFTGGK